MTESAAASESTAAWISDLAFENLATADGRWIQQGALSWRDLPLTLMAMTVNGGGGHVGSYVSGRIDSITKVTGTDIAGDALPQGVISLRGGGVFDMQGENGAEIARLVGDETLRGISVDLSIEDYGFRDPETGEIHKPDEMTPEEWDKAFFEDWQIAILAATVMAATVCATPAFEDARIALVAAADGAKMARLITRFKIVQSVGPPPTDAWLSNNSSSNVFSMASRMSHVSLGRPNVLVAAATGPLRAPREWFETQEPPGPMPLTVTAEGRVFGHIANWDTCHTGLADVCTRPPRSQSGYSYFHVGEVEAEDGTALAVGKLMFSGKHAPLSMSRKAAAQHYDDNTYVGAYVRAVDGQHGIWVAGALRAGLTDEQLAEIKANPPSGDWRPVNGALELIAALAVPVPGYPVPRAQAAIVAAADEMQLTALLVSAGEMIPRDNVVNALVAAGCMSENEGLQMEKYSPGLRSADVLIAAADADPIQALSALVIVE